MWESILESAKGLLLPRLLPHQRPGCQPGELVQHHGSYMGKETKNKQQMIEPGSQAWTKQITAMAAICLDMERDETMDE